jgi:hypothetical protein
VHYHEAILGAEHLRPRFASLHRRGLHDAVQPQSVDVKVVHRGEGACEREG